VKIRDFRLISKSMQKAIKMNSSIFKTFFISLAVIANTHFAYCQTASILPPAKTTFVDQNGKPLTSGTVDFYNPGTTTRKTTWQDSSKSVSNTNPVVLDAAGRALILGDGAYRQVVKDRYGNLIWDQVTSSIGSGGSGGSTIGDGLSVGTILPNSSVIAPANYQFAYGQALSRTSYPELYQALTFTAAITCVGGSTTISVADTSNLSVGTVLESICISGSPTIVSKTFSTVTLSSNATISVTTTGRFFLYGNGDASTTFNLPDLRGYVIAGRCNMGGVDCSVLNSTYFSSNSNNTPSSTNAKGGNQNRALVTANVPPHTHSGTTGDDTPDHTHNTVIPTGLTSGGYSVSGTNMYVNQGGVTGGANSRHHHPFTTDNGTGTSAPFSIVQPTLTLNYVIKVTPDVNLNSTFGVASIGGMTGVIACGANITCAGNTISINSLIPSPTPTTLGGIFSGNAPVNQAVTGVDTAGNLIFNALSGAGNVTGPGSSTIGHIATFGNTTGTLIQDSGYTPSNFAFISAKDYASGSTASTTGTINATSNSLALASALDFKNGQGIRINHAGTASGVSTPTSPSAVAVGTAGATTYTYQVVALSATGGYSAPTATFTVTNGNATLSQTNYNRISWTGAATGFAIYGRIGGSLTFLGTTGGTQFEDYGPSSYFQPAPPDWLPSTVPVGAANNYLITTISSGGGTFTLTLAATATVTATAQNVYHDDTTALQTALTTAQAAGKALDLSGGGFRISSTLSANAPVEIRGSAGGSTALSGILLTNLTQDGITLSSGNYANIHDFSMWGNGTQLGGSGINFSTSTGGHTVRNLNTNQLWNSLNLNGGPYYIYGNLLSGYGNVINIPTAGDSGYINNSISPLKIPGNLGGGGIGFNITGNPGGTKIIGNKINAAIAGYDVAVQVVVTFSDADILIEGNSFEGWKIDGIFIDRSGPFTFANIHIVGNQLAGGQLGGGRGVYAPTTASWISNIVINDNIISASTAGIEWDGGSAINLSGNIITATTGIALGAGTSGCGFGMNNFPGTSTQITNTNPCIFTAVTGTKPAYP